MFLKQFTNNLWSPFSSVHSIQIETAETEATMRKKCAHIKLLRHTHYHLNISKYYQRIFLTGVKRRKTFGKLKIPLT